MKKITLSRPVEYEGKTYSEIEIDEPTLGAVEASQNVIKKVGNEFSAVIAMVSYDTGIPEEALRKIRSSDYKKIDETLGPLLKAAGLNGDQ